MLYKNEIYINIESKLKEGIDSNKNSEKKI